MISKKPIIRLNIQIIDTLLKVFGNLFLFFEHGSLALFESVSDTIRAQFSSSSVAHWTAAYEVFTVSEADVFEGDSA